MNMDEKGGDMESHRLSQSSLSSVIVEKVAAITGDNPTKLDPPLYEVIDPDALDRLFHGREEESPRPNGCVTFTMADCRVTVRSTGTVSVHLDDSEEAAPIEIPSDDRLENMSSDFSTSIAPDVPDSRPESGDGDDDR